SNLLINGIKFTPSGGTITVRLAREGAQAHLSIADTGVGMAPEFLPHAFDRFRQGGNATDSRKGLGLGLAIARELVLLHGGEIEAFSEGVGTGATFTVTLPVVEHVPVTPTVVRTPAPDLPRLDSIGV